MAMVTTKQHKILVLIALVIVIAIAGHSAVQAQGTKKALTIGFAQVGTESSWRKAFTDATQTEAKKRGINLVFVDSENSQEKEIAALRSFIKKRSTPSFWHQLSKQDGIRFSKKLRQRISHWWWSIAM